MAIVNKFVSVLSVLDDVYRDTQLEEAIPVPDLIYWVYEALGLMNQPVQFVQKVTGYEGNEDLDITNYKAKLPCDFYKLNGIAVDGKPVRYAGNSFHHLLDGDCCGLSSNSSQDIFIDNFGNSFSPQASTISDNSARDVVTFDINNNYLTLSQKEGKVCISYWAFPTDKEGFPMIPDMVSYKVAIKKYLIQKLRYIDWAKDPSNNGKRALFDYDEKEWLWYVGKATSDAKMPDPEQMESLKNQAIRLIPRINEHDNFWKTLGAKRLIKIH